MSKQQRNEELVIGPDLGCGVRPFTRYVDGKVAQSGVGVCNQEPEVGDTCLAFGPVKDNGRRDVNAQFTINSRGSRVHSGAATNAYRRGWDEIFAPRKAPSRAN